MYKTLVKSGEMIEWGMTSSAQEQAYKALYDDNMEDLKDALINGANPGHTKKNVLFKDDPDKTHNYTLGETAAQYAMQRDDCKYILLMKDFGADIGGIFLDLIKKNKWDLRQWPVITSTDGGNFIDVLFDNWPFELGNKNTAFSIHHLAIGGYAEKIKKLIDYGYDVNQQDERGMTPLMVARDPTVVKVLLNEGADRKIVDFANKNAVWHHTQAVLDKSKARKFGALVARTRKTIEAMTLVVNNQNLTSDPRALSLSKQIKRRDDAGYINDNIDWDVQLCADFKKQVEETLAADKMKKLGRYIQGKKERGKDLLTSKRTPKI